jgi:hypothetical protein
MTAIPLEQGKFEARLIGRGLEGFQNRAAVELQPSGVTELDAFLVGGFPRDEALILHRLTAKLATKNGQVGPRFGHRKFMTRRVGS